MTPDPYQASGSPSNPQSWNRYAYTLGDPANYSDPSGRDAICAGGLGVVFDGGADGFGGASCSSDPTGGFCDASQEGCDPCFGADGFTESPSPYCQAQGGPPPQTESTPDCTLQLFRRPAKFKGNPGQHTYLELCDGPACEIVEGGRNNSKGQRTYGDLIGFINPPGSSGVLGTGTRHGSSPGHDTQLGSTGSIPCNDIGAINFDVSVYNGYNPVLYAFLPNGASTFNSNSFTYTLLEDVGLQSDFGPFPTNILGGIPFYPGWGFTVPGLDLY